MTLGRHLLLALLAVLIGSASLDAQNPTGAVTGRVVDASTLKPLSGASVRVAERGALTDESGRFVVSGVPAGTHDLRVTRIGYREATRPVAVAAGETVTAEITLTPQAVNLEGLVVVGYGRQEAKDLTGVVQTVTPEEFNKGRVVSPEQLIQGKVAGVQVVDSNEPGGGISLRLRGGTSVNASNEPLIVVDGVPLQPGGGLSAGRNPLNFINPQDIKSVTVLKDASSTAIYGSRGANGVILIETKTGTSKEPEFAYSTSVSTSNVIGRPDMITADQFRGIVAKFAPERVQYLGGANTDWIRAVERSAMGQEHTLAVTGSGDDMNYRLSLGYLGQEGVVQGSFTERFSAALNYYHTLLNDRLDLRATLRSARTDDEFTPGGVLGSATAFDPTQPITTEAGFFEQTAFGFAPNNPLAELALVQDAGTTYRNIANLEGQYRMPFLEGLSSTVRLGYDIAKSERRVFLPTVLQSQVESETPGLVNRSNPTETTGVLDAFLNYASGFGASSEIDATAGYSYEVTRGDYPFFQARGLGSDLLGPNGVPTAEEVDTRLFVRESKLASFFGRVNYSLLDRYLLTLSVRRDGSSRFGPGNQWGTFPAAAFAWRISEEPSMQGIGWLSDLKLRASWGVNGNQAIGDYLWVADYRYGDIYSQMQFGDEFVTTIRPTAVDPNIRWEETTSYNVGFDYGLFGDRLAGSLEYYYKDTEDLLFRVQVPAGGFVSNYVTTNVGRVRNQGVELSLNARVLDRGRRGLRWDAGLNVATNANELVSVNPHGKGGEQILVGGIEGGVGSTIQVLKPGHAVNSFFVLRHKRDANGRPIYSGDILEMYEDVNDDGIINENDRIPFESPAPDWILGHTSQIGYGNMDLGFTVRAYLGNHVYNNTASRLGYYNVLNGASGPVNLHASVLENGFVEPQYFSDVYVEDASFVRMDNVTLGYTFPKLSGFEQLRLFGTVQNVFTLTGYSGVDPTAGLNGIDNNIYPRSRTFSVGASVGF